MLTSIDQKIIFSKTNLKNIYKLTQTTIEHTNKILHSLVSMSYIFWKVRDSNWNAFYWPKN